MPYDALEAFADAINAEADRVVPKDDPSLELHIDGDYLAYHASGNEEASVATARANVRDRIQFFKERTGAAGKIVMHLTSPASSKGERYLIATVKKYQAQRVGDSKPKNWAYLREYLAKDDQGWTPKVWANREADDGIAACAVHAASQSRAIVIGTADKDLRMLPGIHVDWTKGVVTHVKPGDYDVVGLNVKQYGLKWFWLQMLHGDAADNIPGLERYSALNAKGFPVFKPMGEKTAEKMLEDCRDNKSAFERVRELYLNSYSRFDEEGRCTNGEEWADRFVEQAALLWMRTDFNADLLDFLNHKGCSCISEHFDAPLVEAAARMKARVIAQRSKIDKLTSAA